LLYVDLILLYYKAMVQEPYTTRWRENWGSDGEVAADVKGAEELNRNRAWDSILYETAI
jgi:hypothetical protein